MSGTIAHSWNGTILTITSDSGTSSADLKGTTGDTGPRGPRGLKGDVNISSVNGKTGVVQLTAEDVGALPNTTVIPSTAAEVNARADDWLPTAEEVGARANDWLPTPAEIGAAARIHTHTFDDISGVATIAQGGTGASTSAEARANLEITPANIGAEPAITNLPISKGGTGANNASDALINLGGTTKIGAYQFQLLPSGIDLSSPALSEGLYWYEGVATTEKGFPYADESPRWLIEIKGFYWVPSAWNGYRVIILYDFGRDKIWIRRNWWGGWSEWKSIYDTHNIDIQVGTLAVSADGTTLTFPRAFAGTPVVTANSSNQTSVKVENVSATSVKLTAGTSGSTVQWQAIYIPS